VLAAVDHVAAAFEIVDCRIRNWQIRGIDAVCDNGSAAGFLLGREKAWPTRVDFAATTVTFKRNGALVAKPRMSEIMGNPINAVCWLANKLAERNERIEAGHLVLTGAPCRPVDIARGDVSGPI